MQFTAVLITALLAVSTSALPAPQPPTKIGAPGPAVSQPATKIGTPGPPTVSRPAGKPAVAPPSPSRPATHAGRDTLDARAVNYIDTINKWRKTMNVPALKLSTKLQANAEDTVKAGNGKLVHKLNPGTLGQVLAPGKESEFEKVFVGGWVCEIPSLIGGNAKCENYNKGYVYNGQTGHAKIVSSKDYTAVGCGYYNGVWGCDFGKA